MIKRVSFEVFAKDLRAQGFSDDRIRTLLNKMIEKGLAEGSDENGYTLTGKGFEIVEEDIAHEKTKQLYSSMGVR